MNLLKWPDLKTSSPLLFPVLSTLSCVTKNKNNLTPQFLVPKIYVGMTSKIKLKVLLSTLMLALQYEY